MPLSLGQWFRFSDTYFTVALQTRGICVVLLEVTWVQLNLRITLRVGQNSGDFSHIFSLRAGADHLPGTICFEYFNWNWNDVPSLRLIDCICFLLNSSNGDSCSGLFWNMTSPTTELKTKWQQCALWVLINIKCWNRKDWNFDFLKCRRVTNSSTLQGHDCTNIRGKVTWNIYTLALEMDI